jgi:hypothetical protein
MLENHIFTCRRLMLDPYLQPYRKINLKWIKALNLGQNSETSEKDLRILV